MEKIKVSHLITTEFHASEAIKALRTNLIFSGKEVRAIGLTSYGVLHDAVSVDGHQAFYITKGAFSLGME